MKAFITVIGHDTVGVVARVAGLCCELNINIEDVTQSILQGMFAMIMLVDISKCSVSHEELHQKMDALAAEMGMQINLTRQEVFDAMHTIYPLRQRLRAATSPTEGRLWHFVKPRLFARGSPTRGAVCEAD